MKPPDEVDVSTLNRFQRRFHRKKSRPAERQWPDIMKGLSNHERMMLKKIGRGGVETKSRAQRFRTSINNGKV